MTFTSGRLDRSDGHWTLTGTLLVRDVARPVSLTIEQSTVQPGTARLVRRLRDHAASTGPTSA